ncbi:amidase [Corynascus novoguineensis]|uniref:Amidase n=1 Tax=Corynascus novoguineensis TaxID=1126955 RepID=A0AAN7HNN4_9PEZI|nr:amidase [Corynascus novoguineensis]
MRAPNPLYILTASQALDLLKNNTITVEEYARSLLCRIRERDDIVNAWAYLDVELILKQAQALDQIPQHKRGPLHGIAIGVKDSGFNSSAVAILRAAGAFILVCRRTTTEFTVTNSGPETTNPHDSNRTPGGSSCGSAAAVADFQVPLSLGGQTGGSLIRPASFTGVFALKPNHNAISTEGQKTISPTFDTLVADVFGLQDDEAPRDIALTDASVGLIESPMWHRAGTGIIAAMREAAIILENSGVKVDRISFQSSFGDEETIRRRQKVIMSGEARIAFLREYRIDKTKLDPTICELVVNSSGFTHREKIQALDEYASMRAMADSLAAKYSVIVTPSAVDEAPLGLEDMSSATFNTLWTGLHIPVINVPAFVGAHGMPIGISLVAGRFCDQHLLRIGKVISEPLMAKGGRQVERMETHICTLSQI